jgi:NADH:ubiquinone oxidoreductase subunit K
MLCHNSLNSFNLLSSLNQLIIMIQIEYILIISAIMMFAGVFGFLTRRSTLAILLSVELMLNATDLNFAVFNRMLYPDGYEGYFFALFSIAISAAESAIAIAIMINIYRMIKNIQVGELEKMKW